MNTKNKIDKNHLINIIEDILLSDGLSGLSIRKVAAKANISIGGVQYIFGNKEDMINYVIGPIPKREKEILEGSIEKAAESVIEILKSGIDVAMNRFN